MTPSLWQRLDVAAKSAVPATTTVLLSLLAVVPLNLPKYGAVAPVMPLIGLYYWVVFRPTLMPFAVSFGCGLLIDVLTGATLGFSSVVFLIGHWVVLTRRRAVVDKSFGVLWIGFVLFASLLGLLDWVLHTVYETALMPARPALFRVMMTGVTFPLIAVFLMLAHRKLLQVAP